MKFYRRGGEVVSSNGHYLSGKEQTLVALASLAPGVAAKRVAEVQAKDPSSVHPQLLSLRAEGLAARAGSRRHYRWFVTNEGLRRISKGFK